MPGSPHDDRHVVAFLKQYRPLPPPSTATLERQILSRIAQEPPRHCQLTRSWVWLISSTVIAVLLVWTGYRGSNLSPRLAINSEEIEGFLVENWQETLEETASRDQPPTPSSDWLMLAEPQAKYVVSHP